MRNKRIAASFMFLSLALTVHATNDQTTFKKPFSDYPEIIWKIIGDITPLNFVEKGSSKRVENFAKKRPALTKMVEYHIRKKNKWEGTNDSKFSWLYRTDKKTPVTKDKYVRRERHHYPHVEKLRYLVANDLLSLFKGTKIMSLLDQFSKDDINSESVTGSDRLMALLEVDKDFSKEQTVQDFFQSESMRKKDEQVSINVPISRSWAAFFGVAGASLGATLSNMFSNMFSKKKEPSENANSQSSKSADDLIEDK